MYVKEYDSLGEDEEIIHSLTARDIAFYVTNKRILVDRSNPKEKGYLVDESEYKYIAFIQTQTDVGRDYRILGAICLVVGIILVIIGYYYFGDYYYEGTANYFYIIGGLFIIGGLAALFISPRTLSKIVIELSGVPKERSYQIEASYEDMQLLLVKINENRTLAQMN